MEYKDKVTVDQEFKDIVYPLIEFWKQCSEKELERLIRKFGHICRKEFSLYRSSFFLKIKCLSDILLSIAEDYRNNNVILIDILSSWNCLYTQYKMSMSDAVFNFVISLDKDRNVRFYASTLIIRLPQFKSYKKKWEYILSIPNIAPKKKSISTFYTAVVENQDEIPVQYKDKIIAVFKEAMGKYSLHSATVDRYTNVINAIENR